MNLIQISHCQYFASSLKCRCYIILGSRPCMGPAGCGRRECSQTSRMSEREPSRGVVSQIKQQRGAKLQNLNIHFQTFHNCYIHCLLLSNHIILQRFGNYRKFKWNFVIRNFNKEYFIRTEHIGFMVGKADILKY